MAERRRILAHFLVSLLLLACATVARADDAPTVRIKDLPRHLQSVVTVVGRTGYIAEKYEKNGLHVFTVRDDYNGQVFVRTPSKNYPVMGTTYRVVGWANREPNGTIFLDTLPGQFTAVYPLATAPSVMPPPLTASPVVGAAPTPVSTGLLWLFALLCLLMIAVVLSVALRRWLGRPQPEWGELFVTSGPDRGLTVPLRRRRVAVGRGVTEGRDVRLSGGDQTISNCHALLSYKRGELYVTDMSSNGTRVGGETLEPGQKKKINSGDLIHLGTRGTVVIVRLRSMAPAPSGLARFLREPATTADKTLMVPGGVPEDPAWMRAGGDGSPARRRRPGPAGPRGGGRGGRRRQYSAHPTVADGLHLRRTPAAREPSQRRWRDGAVPRARREDRLSLRPLEKRPRPSGPGRFLCRPDWTLTRFLLDENVNLWYNHCVKSGTYRVCRCAHGGSKS